MLISETWQMPFQFVLIVSAPLGGETPEITDLCSSGGGQLQRGGTESKRKWDVF